MWFKRALSDTFGGHFHGVLTVFIGGAIGLVFLFVTQGKVVALAEVPYFWAGLAGAVGSLSVTFLWNLACAPYRLEKDAHEETKLALRDAQARIPTGPMVDFARTQPTFTLAQAACLLAQAPLTNPVEDELAKVHLGHLRRKVKAGQLMVMAIGPMMQTALDRAMQPGNTFQIPNEVIIPRARFIEVAREMGIVVPGLEP